MAESLGHKTITGTVWASIDRIGTMAVQFVVNLILARLLMPEDFGYIGMLAIFIAVSQILIDGGFGAALIQKKEPTQTDYSTVFYWNLLFSITLYGLLFLCAPLIATFFHLPLLCRILRVMGVILIINALVIVQNNRLRKQLAFRTIALVNICSYLSAALFAVWSAYKGMGVWSLVIMQLLFGCIQCLLLWYLTRWLPTWSFSLRSLKTMFGFGGYLLISNILQVVCQNMQGIIIGRKFSASQLGFYSQAKKLDEMSSYVLPNIIVQVIFPIYSQIQNDHKKLQHVLGLSIRIISYLIFPLMLLLILVAEPLIIFLYGVKWSTSILYFQILCIGGIFVCLQNINYYAVAAVGKSKALFNWSLYKWGILLLLLFVGSYWGMIGILIGIIISNINIYIVNAVLVYHHIGYSLGKQMRDVIPILTIGTLSFIGASFLKYYLCNIHFSVIALLFIFLYVFLTIIFRLKIISDIIRIKHFWKN